MHASQHFLPIDMSV